MTFIVAVVPSPWPPGTSHTHATWYRRFDDDDEAGRRLHFALSHDAPTCVLPSDVRLWPHLFEIAAVSQPLFASEISSRVEAARAAEPLYVETILPARQA